MNRLLRFAAIAFCMLMLAPAARADFSSAQQAFYRLTTDEKVQVVLGLIATGDFNGIYMGEYTQRLHAAIEVFQARHRFTPSGVLHPYQTQKLNERLANFLKPLGLRAYVLDNGAKLLIPRALFDTEDRTNGGLAFERNDSTLSLTFETVAGRTFEDLFNRFTSVSSNRTVGYKALRPQYFVSSGVYKGKSFYTWFNRGTDGPTGFTLSWMEQQKWVANRLTILLANAFSPPDAVSASSETIPPGSEKVPNSSGTGFLISPHGHIVTNHHVVAECTSLAVRRAGQASYEADLITSNAKNDLALLKTTSSVGYDFARFRQGTPVQAGEDIVVFGFPLSGVLSLQGNVLPGTVAALSGLGDDNRFLQVSAPVQPGNSGGPLLDRSGNVVGVIQSKLNALKIAGAFGDIPQNVNFAIKGDVAIDFLDWAGFRYEIATSAQNLSVPMIAERAAKFTVLIECIRN